MTEIHIIDSHTEGEPTRLIVEGGPDLGRGSLAQRREVFAREFDHFRSATVNEPRGADHIVGALLCEPTDPSCAAGVIFFSNAGYLQMCGHGTIGLVATLAHMGRIAPGTHRIETPVGIVSAQLHDAHRVSVANRPAYRHAKNVEVEVTELGRIRGDIAWGGNWFFLVSEHGQTLDVKNIYQLTEVATRIKAALESAGIFGADGAIIDHIELFGPPADGANDSRNFVLCPGGQYDRSPCGTGTSAKLACLHADGKLQPGQIWRQESILGTVFEGQIQLSENGAVLPTITGNAFVTAEARLLLNVADPLRWGVRA